ncbi:hypothetical protein [Spiroplasma tabanidicola]|uniref:Uncharacterized protein n=1 Tax=Spiroplasma tabanidicola TaxID=324079 RepID=A0A6I6CAP5_9MOLU|nr:hypothetical protein [Spiroplasma tabanidicola]QGS52001.1 hypothetical protein STABA_v1c06400 [Spiroplasma tabanidicola]
MKKLLLFLSVGSLIGVNVQPIIACKKASRSLSIAENTVIDEIEKEIKYKKYISGDYALIRANKVMDKLKEEKNFKWSNTMKNEPTFEKEVYVNFTNEEISSTISNYNNYETNDKIPELNLIVKTANAIKQKDKLVWSDVVETKIAYQAMYGNNTIPIDDLQKKLDIYSLDITSQNYNAILNDKDKYNNLIADIISIMTAIYSDKTHKITKFLDEYKIDFMDLVNQKFKFDSINEVKNNDGIDNHIHLKATMYGDPPESLFSGSAEIDLFVKKIKS